jgi:hypothetical protein
VPNGGGGGKVGWRGVRVGWCGGGGRLTDRWARCEVGCTKASEPDKPLFARIMCIHFLFLVRFLALFLFPSFPELYLTSPYSDFRVYLSDFA